MVKFSILRVIQKSQAKIKILDESASSSINIKIDKASSINNQPNLDVVHNNDPILGILPIIRKSFRYSNSNTKYWTDISKLLIKNNQFYTETTFPQYSSPSDYHTYIQKRAKELWNIQDTHILEIKSKVINQNQTLYLLYLKHFENNYPNHTNILNNYNDYFWKMFIYPIPNNINEQEKYHYIEKLPYSYPIQYTNHHHLKNTFILSIN